MRLVVSSKPFQQYQAVAVETASPGQLVVMLYDGAIRFCTGAEEAQRNKQWKVAGERINRALDIIHELDSTLNMEAGEVAGNLRRIYEYMRFRLLQGSLRQNPEAVAEVNKLLRDLRGAWAEVAQSARMSARSPGQ